MRKLNALSKSLILLMKESETTQAELAEYLNLSPQTVSRYVNGITEPKIDDIKKIAKFFNISLDALLGEKDY